MKKIIILFIALFISVPIFAHQQSTSSMKILGIPFSLNKDLFMDKLCEKGFVVDGNSATGKFAGIKGCRFSWNQFSNNKDVIYQICVTFPKTIANITLKDKLIDMYSAKYGVCTIEQFFSQKYEWETTTAIWKTNNGTITLILYKPLGTYSNPSLTVTYIDTNNRRLNCSKEDGYTDL